MDSGLKFSSGKGLYKGFTFEFLLLNARAFNMHFYPL
jgi:hypothetical protein